MKRIAVVGCGWFGLPLAKSLLSSGLEVLGTKTTQAGVDALNQQGIKGERLCLGEAGTASSLQQLLVDVDALVVNIPPGLRRGETDYLDKLQALVQPIRESQVKLLVYVSSTGAYPDVEGQLTEQDRIDAAAGSSAAILQQAEILMQSLTTAERRVVTVRFGGLVGAGRNPGRFMAGRTGLANGSHLVNLVHLEDCIAAVTAILHSKTKHHVYNIVSPAHPRKDQFYTEAAHSLGLPAPQFLPTAKGEGKVVLGNLICEELDFDYRYRDAKSLLA
ncbi:NAD(P)H-binding protein [Shewanella avicenniae]|uniref:NAD(P)H-binding protein n=1 Tax=Shewanella avicenniae TaxID=2814294 RepID=A0ABX7QWT0_9GAMM|nr:NAD(P)H-binding protein [Shewanella avicenniae]QSX35093.1 NAD(P)H-binding protein [Shewanella avicenniae]